MNKILLFVSLVSCIWLAPVQPVSGGRADKVNNARPDTLQVETYVAGDVAWNVTSTIIYGKTESILVDSQYFKSDAAKLADRITATKTQLKAIIITHPHEDHYLGLETIHQRFPDAPIYINAGGLEAFKRGAPREIASIKKNHPEEAPESVPTPEVLPARPFTIDGQVIEIMEGHGDTPLAPNSYVLIPSLRTVIAGDMIFNRVHVWLGNSTPQSRANWLKSLDDLVALHPRVVIGGHKRPSVKDSADAITYVRGYLRDFEAARTTASNADEFIAMMKAKYPDAGLSDTILAFTAKGIFPKKS